MTNTINKVIHNGDEYEIPTWIQVWAIVSATEPDSPIEGMLWYDTANSVLKVYDWNAWQTV